MPSSRRLVGWESVSGIAWPVGQAVSFRIQLELLKIANVTSR